MPAGRSPGFSEFDNNSDDLRQHLPINSSRIPLLGIPRWEAIPLAGFQQQHSPEITMPCFDIPAWPTRLFFGLYSPGSLLYG